MSEIPVGCKCEGNIFIDSMCSVCLKKLEEKYERTLEIYEEKVSEIECNLDELRYYLYEEPFEERDKRA